jgi:hypothetical protein
MEMRLRCLGRRHRQNLWQYQFARDTVSGPTPNVGSAAMTFDLNQLGIAPGTYQFCFQVHITEKYNVLFRDTFTMGGAAIQEVKLGTLYPRQASGGRESRARGASAICARKCQIAVEGSSVQIEVLDVRVSNLPRIHRALKFGYPAIRSINCECVFRFILI